MFHRPAGSIPKVRSGGKPKATRAWRKRQEPRLAASWRHRRIYGGLELCEVRHVGRELLAIGELRGAIRPLGVQEVEKRRGAFLKRELGSVPQILCARQVGQLVQSDSLAARSA